MRITALSGGVGGARLLRGLAAIEDLDLTAVVNVADDDRIYGLHVSPDIDTVTYTLAGLHSDDRGWGRTSETWRVMDEMGRFPLDSSFRIGDLDLALNLYRTTRLSEGATLTQVTAEITKSFGIGIPVLPVTDDEVRTRLKVDGSWIDFQDYFVRRRHSVPVEDVRFDGAGDAHASPAVVQAFERAEAIVIGPSNPILSVWPILAIRGVREAIAGKRVLAVSPLIRGHAVKGPLADLLPVFGYSTDTLGVIASYDGLLTDIVVDPSDHPGIVDGLSVHTADTLIVEAGAARRLATQILSWL